MHLAHPLGVAAGQVIIHRDHMNPAPRQGVEVGGQGGHEGLAFTGLHLGNLAVVQHHAANQLDIKVAHAKHPLASLADHRESLGQQFVKQFALPVGAGFWSATKAASLVKLGAKFGGQSPQLVIAEGSDLLLEQVDVGNNRLVALQLAGIGVTQQQLEHGEGLSVLGNPTIAKPWPRAKKRAAARVLGVLFVGYPHLQGVQGAGPVAAPIKAWSRETAETRGPS